MTLSIAALRAVLAETTDEVFLECLTISGSGLATPIRVVNDPVPLVRSAGTFQPLSFELTLPTDSDESLPQVNLSVDNVDQQIEATLRAITGVPIVTLEVVLASQPDVVEVGPYVLAVKSESADASAVQCSLGYDDVLDEPYPRDQFTPVNSPGLF